MFWLKKKEHSHTSYEDVLKEHSKSFQSLDVFLRSLRAYDLALLDVLLKGGLIDETEFQLRFSERFKALEQIDWLHKKLEELENGQEKESGLG